MPAPDLETRTLHADLEVRAQDDKELNKLVGYAAKYNTPSYLMKDPRSGVKFIEVIKPGAFTRTLRDNSDIKLLLSHDKNCVLGRTKSGTLKLWTDEVGLRFEVDLPDTQAARDLKASVARGDLDSCSFAFLTPQGGDKFDQVNGQTVRTLVDVDLLEISAGVAFPAYENTIVYLRSLIPGDSGPVITPRLDASRRKLALLDI